MVMHIIPYHPNTQQIPLINPCQCCSHVETSELICTAKFKVNNKESRKTITCTCNCWLGYSRIFYAVS